MANLSTLRQCLHDQLQLNESIREDIKNINVTISKLERFKSQLQIEIDTTMGDNEGKIQTDLKCLTQDSGMAKSFENGIGLLNDSLSKVSIPLEPCYGKLAIVHCKGCGMKFKKYHQTFEPAYYIHCTVECEKYKELNLIEQCFECKRMFINGISKDRHICGMIKPTKPNWMSKSLYYKSLFRYKPKSNSFIKCPGCRKKFSLGKSYQRLSFQYLVHCIEECDKYKQLNLLQECFKCEGMFLNRHFKNMHKCEITKRIKPHWMTKSVYRQILFRFKPELNSFLTCPGCQKQFERGQAKRRISLQYYVHCIEDCDKYKELDLIRECTKCKYKFLHQDAYQRHYSNVHGKKNS